VTKLRKRLLVGLAVIALASVLTPPSKSDKAGEPILAGAQVDPPVLAILERSCQDCHSEKTYYPWYSYVAPFSWLIENDVSGGRRHLNFSEWQQYSLQRRERLLSEIANQVKDRDMPLTQYTLIHRNAKLSDADVNAIFQWTQKERARLIAESPH
jgi:Haem-binding domain